MAETERGPLDDRRAQRTLDTYYGMTLGCVTSDLRRSGWTFLPTRTESDPMALLFGQRTLVHLVAPVSASAPPNALTSHLGQSSGQPGAGGAFGRGGVATLAPDLRAGLRRILLGAPPERLYTPAGVRTLDALVRASSATPLASGSAAHLCVTYCAQSAFTPYLSPWLDWIEPLDDTSEMDPQGLQLLARFSGGVFVVWQRGHIIAWAGLRAHTPHVREIHLSDPLPEPLESASAPGLRQALFARATRAVFAAQRTPIFTYRADDLLSRRLATTLGYRLYADTSLYLTATTQQ
ncbi:MAG: hypothetical protein ABI068_02325 [Ktedonobacterales bacterium]